MSCQEVLNILSAKNRIRDYPCYLLKLKSRKKKLEFDKKRDQKLVISLNPLIALKFQLQMTFKPEPPFITSISKNKLKGPLIKL